MATTQERMNVPIFVSSTYEDLKAYRDEVERSIIYMNQTIKGMEFFGSTPERPLDKCLQTVRECKLYIGIIGMRYGSVAVKNRIPVLIYILDENHPIASRFVDKGEGAEKLEAFKTRLKKAHVVSSFTTPADLGKKVTQDLMNELKKDRAIEDSLRTLPSDTEGGDYEILRGFLRRPYKYYGQEIILDMLLTPNQTSSVKVALCKGLGLQVGDVSCIRATAKSPDGKESSSIQLFGEGEMADWIDSVREPRSARLKGRLSYCVLKEDTKHDDGVILKDFMYTRMILLDVIEDSLPE